jgi:hypothetical protein
MAIKCKYTIPAGDSIPASCLGLKHGHGVKDEDFVVPDVYWKVMTITSTKSRTRASLVGLIGKENNVEVCVKTAEFDVNLEGDNFIAQAYNYFKTLPEFAGSVDC